MVAYPAPPLFLGACFVLAFLFLTENWWLIDHFTASWNYLVPEEATHWEAENGRGYHTVLPSFWLICLLFKMGFPLAPCRPVQSLKRCIRHRGKASCGAAHPKEERQRLTAKNSRALATSTTGSAQLHKKYLCSPKQTKTARSLNGTESDIENRNSFLL